jgi:putative membrane protein
MIQGLVLVASLVGGAALAQSNMQGGTQGTQSGTMQGNTMQGGKTTPKGMVEHMGFMAPADPKALLERLHHVNQEEIQLGRLAQQNGMSQDVKSYGEMLVKDHTSADEKVMSYAQQKGFKLAEPKPMTDVERKAMDAERANMEKLKLLKGQPFDASFLASMVGGHDMVLGKLMAAQQNVTDTGMTPLLQQLTQAVTQHRQQAYTLLGRIGPGSSAGVGGSGDMGKGMHEDTFPGKDMGTGEKKPMEPGKQKNY